MVVNEMQLNMCIQQGYVPKGCTLDGMIVWGLVNKGEMPCKDCNIVCSVRPAKYNRKEALDDQPKH